MRAKRSGHVTIARVRTIALTLIVVSVLASCVQTPDVHTDGESGGVSVEWDLETPSRVVIPPEYEDTVEETISSMSLRRRIAQRFVVFVPSEFGVHRAGSEDTGVAQAFAKEIWREQPAGFIVYPWNYRARDEVALLTGKLQRLSRPDTPRFFVAADHEGGRVAAFRFSNTIRLPAPAIVGSYDDPEFVDNLAYITGRELLTLGINMNLAPVLDLSRVADAGIVGDRAFGGDPVRVAAFARAYVEGMARAGVIATAKHFPGHGVTRVDSHGRLPVVDLSLERLRSRDLLPFVEAIGAGVPAIMTAHILFPEIDPEWPVTISPMFLRGVLRSDLDFSGLVISDGLAMGALADNYELDETLERALRYGVDIILVHNRYDLVDLIERTERFVAEGRVSPADIDRGTLRVLTLKARYNLL